MAKSGPFVTQIKFQYEAPNIHDFPPEILRQIFLYYVTPPNTPNWSKPTVRRSMMTFATPIPLTHVCAYWRDVACSYQTLWNIIFVLGPSPNMFPLISLWLSRAREFSLYLQFVENVFEGSVESVTAASQELLSKVFWEKRFFWAYINFTFADIPNDDPGRVWPVLPLGGELTVCAARLIDGRRGDMELTVPLWMRVACSPHLQALEVGPLCVNIPHENLKELTCHEPLSRSRVLELIDRCPQLKKLVVVIQRFQDEDEAFYLPDGYFTRNELHHLSILNNIDKVSILPIYNTLTCPQLEHLALGFGDPESGFNDGLYDLIYRSGCSLHTLKGVHIESMTKEHMVGLFSQLQTLVSLQIINPTNAFFELLTLPDPSNPTDTVPLLPHRRTLYLNHSDAVGQEFSNMVISRCRFVSFTSGQKHSFTLCYM